MFCTLDCSTKSRRAQPSTWPKVSIFNEHPQTNRPESTETPYRKFSQVLKSGSEYRCVYAVCSGPVSILVIKTRFKVQMHWQVSPRLWFLLLKIYNCVVSVCNTDSSNNIYTLQMSKSSPTTTLHGECCLLCPKRSVTHNISQTWAFRKTENQAHL